VDVFRNRFFQIAASRLEAAEEMDNMRSIAKQLIPLALAGSLTAIVSVRLSGGQLSPITITRLYTGSDGQTHAASMEITLTPSTLYRQAGSSEPVKVSEAQFFRLPTGKVQDWHNPARRQYVVTLTGREEVEIAERQKIPLSPGRVVLLENVTGRGHITRSLAPDDLTFFMCRS
jgi:hypothetical protein